VLLGLLLLFWPDKGAEALIMFVGAFALLTGLIVTIHASTARYRIWGASMVGGLITLILGLIALFWPGITAAVLVYMIAAWALLFGLIEIIAGLSIGAGSPAGALATGIGLVTVVLALLLFAAPEVGVVAAAWLIALYFLLNGGLTVYHAIEIRRARARSHRRRLAWPGAFCYHLSNIEEALTGTSSRRPSWKPTGRIIASRGRCEPGRHWRRRKSPPSRGPKGRRGRKTDGAPFPR